MTSPKEAFDKLPLLLTSPSKKDLPEAPPPKPPSFRVRRRGTRVERQEQEYGTSLYQLKREEQRLRQEAQKHMVERIEHLNEKIEGVEPSRCARFLQERTKLIEEFTTYL